MITDPKAHAAIAAARANLAAPKPVITPPKIFTQDEIVNSILTIPTLSETSIEEVDHVILYGEPGTGKTVLAGLLAEFFHVLWFDGDKGLTALINNLPAELTQRINVIKIPDSTMFPIMISTMLKVITGRQVNICIEHGSIDCIVCSKNPEAKKTTLALNQLPKNWVVVLDSQTQMVASAMAQVHYKINPSAVGKDIDDYWRGSGDEVFAYWGALKNIMDKFGNYVKDLNCQFVAISHETLVEMEVKGEKKIAPVSGSDNSSRSYAKYYGTQVHAKKSNFRITYSSSATASNTVQSKSRANVALEKEQTPSLLHIFRPKEAPELLKGSYNEWYLAEGWKPKAERKLVAPKPKEILP